MLIISGLYNSCNSIYEMFLRLLQNAFAFGFKRLYV